MTHEQFIKSIKGMEMTPTHLRKKSITEWRYVKYVGMKSKTETHYFCGKARNMTISTEHHTQVTCKKCLAKLKSPTPEGEKEGA